MPHSSLLGRTVAGATVATLCVGLPAAAQALAGGGSPSDAFTTKTTYAPAGNPASYAKAPRGFTPVFTENVSRHGARTLSDSEDGDALLALWEQARDAGALTARSEGLGPAIEALLAANAADGYGLLTSVGRAELRGTAARMAARLPELLDGRHGGVDVVASNQARTLDSAHQYVAALEAAEPGLAAHVGATRTDDALLYFHKQKANADYIAYAKGPVVAGLEAQAAAQPQTAALATAALERSFSPDFVAGLSVEQRITAAQQLFALAQNVPDLGAETGVDLSPYLTRAQAAWFGYLDDVSTFYEKGPAIAGSDITYKMAKPLLHDIIGQLEAKRAGTSTLAAELRFTHAEEVIPLKALLGLRGASEQLPAGTLYTYANSPFRGADVAPMATNLQWDLFSDGSQYLVRMLVDEQPTAFKSACSPIKPGSFFYTLDELERCYDY